MGGFFIATLLKGLQVRMNTQAFLVMGVVMDASWELDDDLTGAPGWEILGNGWSTKKKIDFSFTGSQKRKVSD